MLQLLSVKKFYSNGLILEIPTLTFNPGIYWIKGGNGSGKTTLMKMLAGLIPFEGEIVLSNSIDIRKHKVAYRMAVNYAEAEPLYPSFLTGLDLVSLYQTTKDADPKQVEGLVNAFGLESYIKNPVGTYSSGMMKKLSLVLAFIGNPRVILLDEPLVTLEDQSIPILNHLIQSYHEDKGVTFLLTSHQPLQIGQFSEIKHVLIQDRTVCFL